MRNKDKSLKYCYEKIRIFIPIDIKKSPILGSLWNLIDKAGSTKLVHSIDNSGSKTSLSFDDAFPSVSLFSKKLKFYFLKIWTFSWMIVT